MYFMNILCTIKIYKRSPNFIWTVALIWERTAKEWKNDVDDKNSFQSDAYRPLVACISRHALLPGGVPGQGGVAGPGRV